MIRVVNKYHLGPLGYCTDIVRMPVHRGTPLGNPFPMKDRSQKERDRVCDLYEEWIGPKLLEKGAELRYFEELLQIAREGKDLELVCFCAPKRCHADTVKRLLEQQLCPKNNVQN